MAEQKHDWDEPIRPDEMDDNWLRELDRKRKREREREEAEKAREQREGPPLPGEHRAPE